MVGHANAKFPSPFKSRQSEGYLAILFEILCSAIRRSDLRNNAVVFHGLTSRTKIRTDMAKMGIPY